MGSKAELKIAWRALQRIHGGGSATWSKREAGEALQAIYDLRAEHEAEMAGMRVFEVVDGAIQTVALYDNEEAARAHCEFQATQPHGGTYEVVEAVVLSEFRVGETGPDG